MDARARRSEPPVLVVLAVALFAASLLFDALGFCAREPSFCQVGLHDLQGGVVAFAVTGVLVLAELLRPPCSPREGTLAVVRAGLHYGALTLAAAALAVRVLDRTVAPGAAALVLTALALACGTGEAWLATRRA